MLGVAGLLRCLTRLAYPGTGRKMNVWIVVPSAAKICRMTVGILHHPEAGLCMLEYVSSCLCVSVYENKSGVYTYASICAHLCVLCMRRYVSSMGVFVWVISILSKPSCWKHDKSMTALYLQWEENKKKKKVIFQGISPLLITILLCTNIIFEGWRKCRAIICSKIIYGSQWITQEQKLLGMLNIASNHSAGRTREWHNIIHGWKKIPEARDSNVHAKMIR